MLKRLLYAAVLILLSAALVGAEDEVPTVGWGVRVQGAGQMRDDALNCASTAIVRSGKFKLAVLADVATRDDFVIALRARGLAEGLWVEIIPSDPRP